MTTKQPVQVGWPTPGRAPTQEELVARIAARKDGDPLGFEWQEYVAWLDYEHARPYLKPEVTAAMWQVQTKEALQAHMLEYYEFAWGKANGRRGISANRSVQHYIAWFWLIGDVAFADQLDEDFRLRYSHYGKPQLVLVGEHLGLPWRTLDDGEWTNYESEVGAPADTVLAALGRPAPAP